LWRLEVDVSEHSGKGEKEVQSGIEAWEFLGLVWVKVGIPLSYPKRVVSIIVDMAEGMLARWGRCRRCLGEYFQF
jgi:hypothetical protein